MATEVGVARASIAARVGAARIHADAAVLATIAKGAGAGIAVDAVHTGATIGARILCTVVDVYLTSDASKASPAFTDHAPPHVQAVPSVQARVIAAAVNLLLTVGAVVAHWTPAGVAATRLLCAGASIEAWSIRAGHGTNLAVLAIEALRAGALVVVFQIIAAAAIFARVAVTFVDLDFTDVAGEAGLAAAGVAALARVAAGRAVHAGPVVGAVVEVLVAEEAAPAFLAVALPWLTASAVRAAGVADALVAHSALPADAALALPGALAVSVALAAARQANGFRAVFAPPTSQAKAVSFFVAAVVAKSVIPGTAVVRTAVSIVVFITQHVVRIAQLALLTKMHVL